ncbi:uncharacterized protein LOC106663019 isoform X2 [Cimex lectularius]|nr:uncharacterized protein LOC106663019 isoform X2 [Cimex lectularius]XP_024083099.1 uncharacterized protein LOC106663019 isoform X2 [Cimex lectularius]XP_024083100.1 uncharacterized protein LOC106663019 isoform X2 [Cimex lectularius]XP_024083101.1 uncharacterized protein LOC106663019 isoform X2 [Cimex lectularius]
MTQDYDVSDIECTFGSSESGGVGRTGVDSMTARLRRPEGFKGDPLFADDRAIDPLTHPACRITPDLSDIHRQSYLLQVTDFSRCGVLRRNGFVHVRVWFPQFPGVVMMSDQELIIMCKPPEPTIIENKAAGFAGSLPHGARVSGVVEETPGRLEYEVALYKEAPARITNSTINELPVDQAVPIGTKLQLRARINPKSAWKYVKLMEVAVSPDPDEAHALGSVALVRNGCRNSDFSSIIPHQPARYRERHNEVFLDFEAFLLSSMRERSTLWIHSQIKACMDPLDCQPEYCMDQYEPSGHGRRRKREGNMTDSSTKDKNGTNQYTKFKENIEYTVLMPGDVYSEPNVEASCQNMLLMSAALGSMLFTAAFLMCYLAARLHAVQSQSAQSQPKISHFPPRSTLT